MKDKLQVKLAGILKINTIIDVSGFKNVHNIYCDVIDRSYVDKGLIALRDDLIKLLESDFNLTHILVEGKFDMCRIQVRNLKPLKSSKWLFVKR